jgi:hypothetical protein
MKNPIQKEYLVGAVLLLSWNLSISQNFVKGYIVANDGSRLDGLIHFQPTRQNTNTILLKVNKNAPIDTYNANNVAGFFLEIPKAEFIAMQENETTKIFAEVLIKGNASIFSFQKTLFITRNGDYFTLRRPMKSQGSSDRGEAITNKMKELREIGKLKNYLNDCGDYQLPNLNKSSIVAAIEKYNACKGDSSITYYSRHARIGVTAGLTVSKLNFKASKGDNYYLETINFDPSIGYSIGASAEFHSGEYLDRSTLNFGLVYSHNKYQGEGIVKGSSGSTQYNNITFEISRLKLPASLKFYRNPGQRGFAFQLGIEPSFVVSIKQLRYIENYLHDLFLNSISLHDFIEPRKLNAALFMNTGYDFFLGKRTKLSICTALSYDFGFTSPSPSFSSSFINLNLGTVIYF